MTPRRKIAILLACFFASGANAAHLMVIGGAIDDVDALYTSDVELVNLTPGSNLTCAKPADLLAVPEQIATYVADDGKVLVCGGDLVFTDCYSYNKESNAWDEESGFVEARAGARGAMVGPYAEGQDIGAGDWWVTGGVDLIDGDLDSTEAYIESQDNFILFDINLPVPTAYHSFLAVNETSVALVNGRGDAAGRAWISYANTGGVWIELPAPSADHHHGFAGVARSDDSDIREIVVGEGESAGVEIFSLDDWAWRAGPELPGGVRLTGPVAVEYNNVIYVIGGDDNGGVGGKTGDIWEYRMDGGGRWDLSDQKLGVPRARFAAAVVPDEALNCS